MQDGIGGLMLTEFNEIRHALFGSKEPEERKGQLTQEHREYARLIDETYKGNNNNFGDYEYNKSLYINNFLTPFFTATAVERVAEQTTTDTIKNVIAKRVGLLRELGGRERVNYENYNFLNYLAPIIRRERYIGMETTLLTPDDTGLDETFEVEEPFFGYWYEPDIYKYLPLSFIGVAMFGISYQRALDEMEIKPDKYMESNIFKTKKAKEYFDPRINYYRKGDQDIFAIRGTKDTGDLANDAVLGAQEASGFGAISQALTKKIDIMEKFILDNKRENSEVILVGHSLGSIEIGILHKRLGGKINNIKGVGYAHPVLPPRENNDLTFYSYKYDPLYEPSGKSNHFFLDKGKTGKNLSQRFKNFHSINNYF